MQRFSISIKVQGWPLMRSVTCFQQLVRPCLASFIEDIHSSKQACICWGHAKRITQFPRCLRFAKSNSCTFSPLLFLTSPRNRDFYYFPFYKWGNRCLWLIRVLSSHTGSQRGSQELSSRCLYTFVQDDQGHPDKEARVVLGLPYNYHPKLNKRRLKVLANHTHLSQSLVNLRLTPQLPHQPGRARCPRPALEFPSSACHTLANSEQLSLVLRNQ